MGCCQQFCGSSWEVQESTVGQGVTLETQPTPAVLLHWGLSFLVQNEGPGLHELQWFSLKALWSTAAISVADDLQLRLYDLRLASLVDQHLWVSCDSTAPVLRPCDRLVSTPSMFDILHCNFLCRKELADQKVGIVTRGPVVDQRKSVALFTE